MKRISGIINSIKIDKNSFEFGLGDAILKSNDDPQLIELLLRQTKTTEIISMFGKTIDLNITINVLDLKLQFGKIIAEHYAKTIMKNNELSKMISEHGAKTIMKNSDVKEIPYLLSFVLGLFTKIGLEDETDLLISEALQRGQ